MTAPTTALAAGVGVFLVTLGARGAVYFSSPAAADGLDPVAARWRGDPSSGGIRTARVPAPAVDALDPTGCGDVFGATCFARLLAGEPVEEAIRQANHAAARTATFHGASGLAAHLRGQLVRT
jgi:sugar/nucleoside kinase (ribokinase family)